MIPQLATLLTDIEFFIQDIRAFKTPDDEIDKKLDSFHFQLGAYLMDKSIEEDLAAGKRVMGRMRNPKTGQDEEMSHTGMICQKCGGHWLWGLAKDGEMMDKSIEEDLVAGKRVMGRMRNPKTGQDEEMSHTGMICQKCGGHWLWGLAADGKTFFCPKCSKRTDELVPVDEKETPQEQAERMKAETAYEEEGKPEDDQYHSRWTPVGKEIE